MVSICAIAFSYLVVNINAFVLKTRHRLHFSEAAFFSHPLPLLAKCKSKFGLFLPTSCFVFEFTSVVLSVYATLIHSWSIAIEKLKLRVWKSSTVSWHRFQEKHVAFVNNASLFTFTKQSRPRMCNDSL